MVQIKELEIAKKRKTEIWYSEKSRTYEIFKKALAGANLPSIRQDIIIITNLNNILFAKVANELQWKGPVVLMTDSNQTKCETYDDIHKTMKKIKEQDAVATSVPKKSNPIRICRSDP
ncbi:hypothetical protein C1646_775570 [Rhizophagus diaphanus]|nr:hypothetical protein C1646_775570 [Rhizophagus diaphanus] [Rhizophagus sp. MUCL 43196]